MLLPPTFSTPTLIATGLGSRWTVGEHARSLGGGTTALFGDASLADAGFLGPIEDQLRVAEGVTLGRTVLSGVNPTVADAEQWAAELAQQGIDVIVAVGGGSTQSLAKAVALRLTNARPILDYAWGARPLSERPIPTIAIPTTAGSGAEVSSTFVLYDDAASSSIAFPARGNEPDVALLDGELLISLPEDPMRDAALDAYSHAFEALWGRRATTFSSSAAFEALGLIRRLLPVAMADRRPEDLQLLLEASTLANIACGNAGLGLVHALTSASGIHVPHGRQNGIVLPIVAEFNRPLLSDAARAEIDRIDEFYDAISAVRAYAPEDLPANALDAMVAAASSSPLRANNIRETSDEELRELAAAAVATSERVAP